MVEVMEKDALLILIDAVVILGNSLFVKIPFLLDNVKDDLYT